MVFYLAIILLLSPCASGFDSSSSGHSTEGSQDDGFPCRIKPSSVPLPFNWFCHSSSSGLTVEGPNGSMEIENLGQIQPNGPFVYKFNVPLHNQGSSRVLFNGREVARFLAYSEDRKCLQTFSEFDESYSCNHKELSLLNRYFDWWSPNSVTEEIIQDSINKERKSEMVHVVISQNKIYSRYISSVSKNDALRRIFLLLESVARKVKLPDVEFLLNLNHEPVVTWNNLGAHVFGSYGTEWHRDIPLPTDELIETTFSGKNLRMAVRSEPWAARTEKLYFRGKSTSKTTEEGNSSDLQIGLQLTALLKEENRSDLLDVKFQADLCKENEGDCADSRLGENKYVLYMDENSRYRMHTLLTSGSAIAKMKEPYNEYYYEMMKPFRHYIEMRNLGSLVKNVEWFKNHDEKMRKVAEEGYLFALQHLQVENILCWTAHAVRRVKEKLAFEPVPREGMELFNSEIESEVCEIVKGIKVNDGRCSERVKQKYLEILKEVKLRYQGCVQLSGFSEFLLKLWDPNNEKIILFNVGANKGYNQLEWMEMWIPQLGKGPVSWGEELMSIYGQEFETLKLCGACKECRVKLDVTEPVDKELPDWLKNDMKTNGIEMYAVEPSPANFNLLKHLKVWSGFESLKLVNAAVSNDSFVGKFPNTTLGSEIGKIREGGTNLVDVQIWTLDKLVEAEHLSYIHYLLIDTEGHDPLVLLGGRRILQKKLVSIIEFEYNKIGLWAYMNLEDTIEILDGSGYDCFLKVSYGMPRKIELLQLTKCWTLEFDYRGWSNVLCYDREIEEIGKFLKMHVNL